MPQSRLAFSCLVLLFLGWGAALYACAADRDGLRSFLKEHAAGFLAALALTALLVLLAGPRVRVLNDEPLLLNAASSMRRSARVETFCMVKNTAAGPAVLDYGMDKRPLAFPFCVAALHLLSGERAANAFAVNFVLAWLLLCCVFALVRGPRGPAAGFSALLLTASQPLLALSAASAGMDLMSTCFIMLSFLALRRYLRLGDGASFALLWTTLLVLANVRYEGPLFLALAAAGLALAGKLGPARLKSWPAALTPFALFPVALQRFSFPTPLGNPPGVPPFSAGALAANAAASLKALLHPGFFYPYNPLLNLLGLVAALLYALRLLRGARPGEGAPDTASRFAFFGMAVFSLLLLSYYSGSAADQPSARLFLPVVAALSVAAAMLMGKLAEGRGALFIACSALMFAVYAPVTARGKFYSVFFDGYRQEADFLAGLGGERVLVVSDNPVAFSSLGYFAVDGAYAAGHRAELAAGLAAGLYSRMIAFSESPAGGPPPAVPRLYAGLGLAAVPYVNTPGRTRVLVFGSVPAPPAGARRMI